MASRCSSRSTQPSSASRLYSNSSTWFRSTQTAFSRLRRDANVRGAFVVRAHRSLGGALSRVRTALGTPHDVHGKRILLVDDIFTTGSTVNECARTLRHAGAREVLVATVARAVR